MFSSCSTLVVKTDVSFLYNNKLSRLKFYMVLETADMDINDPSVTLHTVPFPAVQDGATYLGALVRSTCIVVVVLPPNLPRSLIMTAVTTGPLLFHII